MEVAEVVGHSASLDHFSSFLRFLRVLPLLPDVDVVVPCLPGSHRGKRVRPGSAAAAALAERVFDVRRWQEHAAGGNCAAWEHPEASVRGVRAAGAPAEED